MISEAERESPCDQVGPVSLTTLRALFPRSIFADRSDRSCWSGLYYDTEMRICAGAIDWLDGQGRDGVDPKFQELFRLTVILKMGLRRSGNSLLLHQEIPDQRRIDRRTRGRAAGLIWLPDHMCSILLVEDHLDTQRAFAAILRSWGHTVSTSDCVAGGLRFLVDNEVDVVLSDIGLPDRSGYEFFAE